MRGSQCQPDPASDEIVDAPAAEAEASMLERRRIQLLYQLHSQQLIRGLTRRTGCRDLASDLAQETFVRLLRLAPAKIQRIQRPDAFLGRVARNLLNDRLRSQQLEERVKHDLEAGARSQYDQVVALETRDTLRRLERAVARLKPKTRDIFLLHRVDGLSYAEIAERMGLSVKGVEKQMAKAIANISRLLDRA